MPDSSVIPLADTNTDKKINASKVKTGTNYKRTLVNNGYYRKCYSILTAEEIAQGKNTNWSGLEVMDQLMTFTFLTALYLDSNQLVRIPIEISNLIHLRLLDLSKNKLRSLPAELGDMHELEHLGLSFNQLRVLPYELGKLFKLNFLGFFPVFCSWSERI